MVRTRGSRMWLQSQDMDQSVSDGVSTSILFKHIASRDRGLINI